VSPFLDARYRLPWSEGRTRPDASLVDEVVGLEHGSPKSTFRVSLRGERRGAVVRGGPSSTGNRVSVALEFDTGRSRQLIQSGLREAATVFKNVSGSSLRQGPMFYFRD